MKPPCSPGQFVALSALLSGLALLSALPLQAQSTTTATATPGADGEDQPIVLSPFEVNAANDRGYKAFNTLSGSRVNTRLEDIAASLSVVTKQQLLDTAATDINDVFLYEANTEGIYQWTSFTLDRGNVSDDIQADPHNATRMRGLTAPNVSTGLYRTSLPLDTYNIDSIEISRGPNSSLFGLGSSGGGINVISAKANPTKSSYGVSARTDAYGSFRTNFDFNQPVVKDKLAVRVLGVYDDRRYRQEPAQDLTRRLQAAVTARPFQTTTIRGSFESYRNFANRPNSTTPRDMWRDWISSGKPTWDPITQTVHLADGTSIGPVTTAQEAARFPVGLNVTDTGVTGRPSWYIDNGQVELYMINRMPAATPVNTAIGPANIAGTGRLLQNTTNYLRNSGSYPLFTTPGVSDRSFYDWTSINLAAPNRDTTRAETSNIELEQIILHTPRQTLALQGGWLYERINTNARSFLGKTDGGKMQVYIDVNEKLLDGTANPYFLRPYIGGSEPAFRKSRNNSDNYRGMLAYQLDLTRENGWLKWFGRQNFLGYGEYREVYGGSFGYKDTMSSTEAWMTPTAATFSRNGASFRAYPRIYVGDANGQNVDYAPVGYGYPGSYTLRYYNGVTNQWIDEPVDFTEYYYANRLNRRLLSTYGGIWQASLWKDRIVPLAGFRRDFNRTREGNPAIAPSAATNGFYDTSDMNNFGTYDWVERKGDTSNYGVVVRPFTWLGLAYSQSDSFNPTSQAYDIYGQPLSDPQADTKDYGFDLNLFPDAGGSPRLSIRARQYETVDHGRGTSSVNTIVQRAIRLDADGNQTGGDPDLEAFYQTELGKLHPDWTITQIDAVIPELMGVDPAFIDSHRNKTHNDNSDAYSRGKEVEIIANPTSYWTIRSTITQAQAFNAVMSPALQEYVAARTPVWMAAKSPFDGSSFWDGTYRVGSSTPKIWYTTNLLAPMKLAVATQGKPIMQNREWKFNLVTNYQLRGITDQRWLKNMDVGGGIRWEDRAIIGYAGAAPDPDGVIREYDASHPFYDKDRAYFDVMAGYNLKLRDKYSVRFQLNVRNIFEDGRLQAAAVNPDGSTYVYRIIDPRQIIFTVSFRL
ncbi:TonB-dependent receptor plug domain-containing protein [Opitutus terrae]|uniref:TonB-dependent receptor plug n=1 Tax=Opitutus terrae (strain DSM 11246 / JCM 15787 / PB90-1) TaxID=452637 RepID=B1ZP53_OPITP|nr:TonB-dependent receptor plug domain-containing protein [Opitutus terrae]ACB77539.1 TonB-dependent receptor plug [Opitutus terrae PB90-1]